MWVISLLDVLDDGISADRVFAFEREVEDSVIEVMVMLDCEVDQLVMIGSVTL